jgi:hypothetical protein
MDIQTILEQSLYTANQLHNTYNNSETLKNLEYIKYMIEKIKEFKIQNREINMNYNQLVFDFAIYRSEIEDKNKPNSYNFNLSNKDEPPDSIDIYE